jgi:hypothetical protein
MTAVEIRNQLERVREVNVSERTVRRRLGEANLVAYRPATGLDNWNFSEVIGFPDYFLHRNT